MEVARFVVSSMFLRAWTLMPSLAAKSGHLPRCHRCHLNFADLQPDVGRYSAMFDPTPEYPWSANGLLSSPHAQTTIPLGDKTCLLLTPEGDWRAV